MRTLTTAKEIRKFVIQLVEGFSSFGVEGLFDHCAIVIDPFPSFNWEQGRVPAGVG